MPGPAVLANPRSIQCHCGHTCACDACQLHFPARVLPVCAALRLMEVRLAYAEEDFEWDQVRKLSCSEVLKVSMKRGSRARAACASQGTELPSF